jgi:hypothetical protein
MTLMARAKRRRINRRQQQRDAEHRYKLALLRDFVSARGWGELRATTRYRGIDLYSWVHGRRTDYKEGTIRDFLVPELDAIPGWSWDPRRDQLRRQVDALRKFVRANGWNKITINTEIDGMKVSGWCAARRVAHRKGAIAPWLAAALEAIPSWSWEPVEEHYQRRLDELRTHVAREGWDGLGLHTVGAGGVRLGKWANHVRDLRRRGRLPTWVVDELEAIEGWMWDLREEKQRRKLEALRLYASKHGFDAVTKATIVGGLRIGEWVANCLHRYKVGVLPSWLKRELANVPGWSRRVKR